MKGAFNLELHFLSYMLGSLVVAFIYLIFDFIEIYFSRKFSKKANYNCFNCLFWSCPSKNCIKKRGV